MSAVMDKPTVSSTHQQDVDTFMEMVNARSPNEPEFHQAVHEVVESVLPYVMDHEIYQDYKILERLTEPDRIFSFRVAWQNDKGETEVNRGYRIEYTNCIGPYKGGLRFHPTVNQSLLKFLAFEQTFKNSLTGLPMGAGKGGSNFDPKGKSDGEVMRFCQAFMTELCKYIGANTDVPAGDIGVGGREIGYLFGQFKRIRGTFEGVLTGKPMEFGGSLIRPEATGYGTLYFAQNMLEHIGDSMKGKVCTCSGSGNVAQYATEKAIEMGAKVVTLSDSGGTIHDPDGIDTDKLAWVMNLKNVKRGRISEYVEKFPKAEYKAGVRPWAVPCDVALPCATQNEVFEDDAKELVKNGCKVVSEGANMPSVPEAIDVYMKNDLLYGLGKAANAGGVAVSGLEMSQNSLRLNWTRKEVDDRLQGIMKGIHDQCVEFGTEGGKVDYPKGANIAGFKKIADALVAQGVH